MRITSQEDSSLLSAISQRDKKAFDALFRKYYSVLCAYCHRFVDLEDAEEIGLTDIVKVTGNGSNVGGTWFPGLSNEARTLLEQADVILAKGQGNFETMNDCGLNVYYLFLCKCDLFQRRFHAKALQGMFLNERRIQMEMV